MKKISLLLGVVLSILLLSCSEDESLQNVNQNPRKEETSFITSDEALGIAQKFLESHEILGSKTKASTVNLNLVYTDPLTTTKTKSSNQPTYYIINIDEQGYVIVAADKRALPVLGYSTESKFDPDVIPVNMKDILIDYKSEINYARKHGVKDLEVVAQVREDILNGVTLSTKAGDQPSIQPLLGNIKWNQNPYYNDYCPPNTPVGCVATAQSQIMYYWKYPASSEGSHSYRHPDYGTLSYNYNRDINWNAMQPNVLRNPNDEIASFCYGVAVSLDMSFGLFRNGGSYTYQDYVPRSLTTYYKYPSNIRNLRRNRYQTNQWMQMVYDELKAGRPVQYAGSGTNGGHSFVCDGYSRDGYFHFNWGWGGMADGYFLLHALNPGSLGTGGGTGGYNNGQQAVFGFRPPAGVDPVTEEDVDTPYGLQASNITSSEADLSWNKADGAKKYTLQIRERYTYNWVSFQTSDNSFKVTDLQEDTSYEWRVRGENNSNVGDYSSTKTFRTPVGHVDTVEELDTPYGLQANNITSSQAELIWYNVDNAKKYTIQIRERYSYNWVDFQSTTNNFIITELDPETTYEWRVRAEADNVYSYYAYYRTFRTLAGSVEPEPTPVGEYCVSKANSSETGYVRKVSIGSMTNYSYNSTNGYEDFTSKNVYGNAGYRLSYTFTPGFSRYSQTAYWCGWIDLNNNGEFESSERFARLSGRYSVYGSFNLPSSLQQGEYRIRISMKLGSYPSSACETFSDGEVEDYTLKI